MNEKHRAAATASTQPKGRVHAHHHEGRKRRHQDDGILVDADEKEVENGPDPAGAELLPGAEDGPAVILLPFPEAEAVSPFPGEVEGQAGAPEGGEAGHDDKAQAHASFSSDNPGVGNREQAPELVHLAVVPRQFPDDEAPESARAADDEEGFQHVKLGGRQRRAYVYVQKRAGDQRKRQHRSNRTDFHGKVT